MNEEHMPSTFDVKKSMVLACRQVSGLIDLFREAEMDPVLGLAALKAASESLLEEYFTRENDPEFRAVVCNVAEQMKQHINTIGAEK